jgi:hypothetical protein
MRDFVSFDANWLRTAKEKLEKLAQDNAADRAVLVSHSVVNSEDHVEMELEFDALIVEPDMGRAVDKVY